VAVVPPVPEFEPAWVAVVVEPGDAEEVAEVDVDPLAAVVVLDVAEGGGNVCVVAVLVVVPVAADPELVVAVEVVDVGAGLVVADVFEELCVLELPPLTVGSTLIEGWTLGWTLMEGWRLGATLIAGSTLIVGWKLMSAMAVALGLLRPCPRCDEDPLMWVPPELVCPLVSAEFDCALVSAEVDCTLVLACP